MHILFLYNILYCIGKSTHNQRIERLWRDVFQGCLSLFYHIFNNLEMNSLLDPDNNVHMWSLHMFIYLWSTAISKHGKMHGLIIPYELKGIKVQYSFGFMVCIVPILVKESLQDQLTQQNRYLYMFIRYNLCWSHVDIIIHVIGLRTC